MYSKGISGRFLTLLVLMIMTHLAVYAQDSLGSNKSASFNTSYKFITEFYSSVDCSIKNNESRPDFIYSHKRLNAVSPNLTLLRVAHGNENVRFNAGFMLGDYSAYNLAAEKGFARNIFEANAEVRLSKKKAIYLTGGIFPSHIGMESAIGENCMTLTRSIVADNSPYYETGIKLSYSTKNEKWNISALLLNGWQRINSHVDKVRPGSGTQINFTPNKIITFSWNMYAGNVNGGLRIYNNIYMLYSGAGRISGAVSFDVALQNSTHGKQRLAYAPVLIAGFRCSDKIKSAIRLESYNDSRSAIISTVSGFRIYSASVNFDWAPAPFITMRAEYKYGNSPLNNFNGESQSSLLTAAIIISVQ